MVVRADVAELSAVDGVHLRPATARRPSGLAWLRPRLGSEDAAGAEALGRELLLLLLGGRG